MVGLRAVAALMVVAALAAPASADDPSQGSWPLGRGLVVPGDLERGPEWVRSHPMMVASLVVSMGDPPAAIRNGYFGDFGANTIWLWKDGAHEVDGWQAGGNPVDFVTWLDNDGTSLVWDPFLDEFESSGLLLGGLAPGTPGRVGYQVGDEPGTVAELDDISAAMDAIRVADPEALLLTNFTFYAQEREELLARWVDGVDEADIQVSTDYFYGREHYTVLEFFRNTALAKGVPYWQYLNAYVGEESGFLPTQTASDLRWQAMVGLAYGYTGHIWFFYQANDEGHPTATGFGGSILHDGVGEFDASRTANWATVASVNRELTNLGQAVIQLTSTDVRYIGATHPDTIQPFNTRWWSPGAGGDPYLRAIGPAAGEGPMDIIIGYFRDPAGQLYLMVQNARHTHSMGIDGSPLPEADEPGTIRLRFDFTGAPYYVDRSRLEYLDPADGKVKVLPLNL
ncbi:MAG: hypothetical protein OEM22_03105, partial [Acidimicrobiia bacterium]|nr:hypothetical protein [Acidimicrobiia bacterium]